MTRGVDDRAQPIVTGAVVHRVLGSVRTDGMAEELAGRVLEPLRVPRRRKRGRP